MWLEWFCLSGYIRHGFLIVWLGIVSVGGWMDDLDLVHIDMTSFHFVLRYIMLHEPLFTNDYLTIMYVIHIDRNSNYIKRCVDKQHV
jgi:hypothetical protein